MFESEGFKMRANYQRFDFENSKERIKKTLRGDVSYNKSSDIPKLHDLTFKTGTYVNCASLFIDLRGSSSLIEVYGKDPKILARLYRAYISEMVAIVNSFKSCQEVNIIGDCVSAMFAGDQGEEKPVIEALRAASMCNGMMRVLNAEFKKTWGRNFKEIEAGIGVALGQALVIKAGYSETGIHDLVYMGDVVNKASKMSGLAHKKYNKSICVTESVYENAGQACENEITRQTFQSLLTEESHSEHEIIYTGDFAPELLSDWAEQNSDSNQSI